MIRRFTVYCAQPVGELMPEQLVQGVASTDWLAAAEAEGVLPELAESAVNELLVENTDESGFFLFRMCYQAEGAQPIEINTWPPQDSSFTTLISDLEDTRHPSRKTIRQRVKSAVAVIELAFGTSSQEAMAPVLARAAAVCLANWFDGTVLEPDQTWWEIDSAGKYRPLAEDPADESPSILGYARANMGRSARRNKQQFIWRVLPPSNCPACGEALYDLMHPRKEPSLSIEAKMLLAVAMMTTLILYLVIVAYAWSQILISRIPVAIALLLALVPGIAIAMAADQLPKTLHLRCRKCNWGENYIWEKAPKV